MFTVKFWLFAFASMVALCGTIEAQTTTSESPGLSGQTSVVVVSDGRESNPPAKLSGTTATIAKYIATVTRSKVNKWKIACFAIAAAMLGIFLALMPWIIRRRSLEKEIKADPFDHLVEFLRDCGICPVCDERNISPEDVDPHIFIKHREMRLEFISPEEADKLFGIPNNCTL